MRKFNDWAAFICAAGSVIAIASSAAAYTPKWLECTGQMVTAHNAASEAENTTNPVHDYYVYDDDSKNIYKYNETSKLTVPEPMKSYDNQKIEWAIPEKLGHEDPYWNAELDRNSLALKQVFHEPGAGDTTTWTEQCKATGPVPDAK